jgi:hypothetical protein
MISTRSTAAAGIVLTSTTIEALEGVVRRPLIRTRLRFAPRLRSETVAEPGVLVAVGWMSPPRSGVLSGANCGRRLRFASIEDVPEAFNTSSLTVTMGLLDS